MEQEEKKKIMPKPPTGHTSLRRKDLRSLRANAMAAQKIHGETYEAIGQRFKLHPTTVRGELDWARRENLLISADRLVIEELLPKALAVIDKHLGENNYEAAKDVAFGTGVLNKNRGFSGPIDGREITIDMVRARIKATKTGNAPDLGAALLAEQERDYATRRPKKPSKADSEVIAGEVVGEQ